MRPEAVLRELFDAAAAELRDEVNVPVEHQHGAELLGVVRDLSHGGRCGLEFLVRLKVRPSYILLVFGELRNCSKKMVVKDEICYFHG